MKITWRHSSLVILAVLLFAQARPVSAQNSQFAFDLPGDLLSITTGNTGLPQIIGQPQMQVVIPGDAASFSVLLGNTAGVSYQWFFSGSAIAGATSDSLLITDVSTNNQGSYWVLVSNASGVTASGLANLYIDSRGCGMPDSWQLQYFGNLNQPADGDYDGSGDPNLQDFLNGANPTNAASALYQITVVNDGGTVVLSPNQSGYTNGQVVTLTATGSSSAPFHAWTGAVTTRSNSIAVTMTTNLTLFAHFLPFTFVWTNVVLSGDWNVASNWSPNLIPGENESVYLAVNATVTENSNVDLVDFTLGNSVSAPTLTGSGRITISGIGVWNSGTMGGSGSTVVQPSGSLALSAESGTALSLSGRTLENAGLVEWGGGNFGLGGVITNDAGAQFEIFGPAVLTGGIGAFDNAGTLSLAANVATTIEGAFNDYGTVNFPGGTLTLSDGGILAGSLSVPAGSELNLAGGIFTSTSNLSITGPGTFVVSFGTATLAGMVNVSGSNIFGPGSGSVNFTGTCICTNNSMTISGSSATFNGTGLVSPSTLTLSGPTGALGGTQNVTIGNAMTWTGGAMNGTGRTIIPNGAALTISNSSIITINSRTLDNAGATTWSGAIMNLNGGVITNEFGAQFQVQSPVTFEFSGGSPSFNNSGTFSATGSGAVNFIDVALNNYNTVGIQGGTLTLSGGGTNIGSISVPAGATINFGAGIFTSSSGSSISGAGSLLVSGGTETLAGTVNLTGSNVFSNGIIDFTGNYICTNNLMVISSGYAGFDGTGTVAPATLNFSSGTLAGAQTVAVGSTMSWTGGAMSGTGRTFIPAGATLTISNSSFLTINSRTLDNGGTVVWNGAASLTLNGAVITNRPGALFNAQIASPIQNGGGAPRIDNAGTFRKSVSASTLTFGDIIFTNYGTVDIESGILYAELGGYASSSNALLNCAIGGTSPGTNYGQLQVAGFVTLNGTLSVNLTNNYIPMTNDSFTVLTAGTRNGTFANFIYPSNQVSMLLSNTSTSVIVRATNVLIVPDPPLLPLQLSDSNVTLIWTAVSNTIYRAEFNPDLNPSHWNALPGDVIAVTNVASKLDILTSSNRFYRIQVVP
jgi:hypothetical protein